MRLGTRAARSRFGVGLIALACVALFAQTARFAFVYDDHWTIVHNRWMSAPLGRVLSIMLGGRAQAHSIPDATRPTMFASTWIDHRLFGMKASAFHLHSVLLYVVVTLLAVAVLFFISGRRRVAFAGGLFFAIAPVHAEVVSAINYREDMLAALGVLVPLVILLPRRAQPLHLLAALGAGAAWLVGLGAKESALALVPILVALMIYQRVDRQWVRNREHALLALGATLVVWCNWRASLFLKGDDVPRAPFNGVADLLLRTSRFEVRALGSAFAPVSWSPEYAKLPAASPLWVLGLAAAIAVAVLLARRRQTRVLSLGIALALLAPLAASPLARPANELADRYLFLAVLGGALVYGTLWDRFVSARGTKWGAAALAIVVVPLAIVTLRASSAWRNDESLWRTASERAPQSPRAWTGLARVRRLAGEVDHADAAVDRALALDAVYLPAHVTRAYNQLARGDVVSAKDTLEYVVARGGATLGGVSRGRRCAGLEPDRARRCAIATP